MDIVWKIITGVAALFLAVAALFSWWNRDALIQEQGLLERAQSNLKLTNSRSVECEEALAVNTAGRDNAVVVRDQTIQGVKETEAASSEAEADIANYKQQNTDIGTKIAAIKKKIEDFDNIEELIASVKKLEADIGTAEAGVASRTQTLDIAVAQVAAVKEEIGRYQELVSRQLGGTMAPDWKGGVTSVHPTWGFAVIDKGNTGDVYQGSVLEVRRGEEVAGKVRVSRVEQTRAIASFIPDTWGEGDMPRPGDVLLVPELEEVAMGPDGAPLDPALPADPGAPDVNALLPEPGEPMADTPFGGAGDSPFGETPAPAEPDAGGDPFGGGMAPEPAAPASTDPFG